HRNVAPTRNGRRPRARLAEIEARADGKKRAAQYDAAGASRWIRWWATRARSAQEGLAVPTSIPRYTWAESTETISSDSCPASRNAAALLPLPVGPSSATTCTRGRAVGTELISGPAG